MRSPKAVALEFGLKTIKKQVRQYVRHFLFDAGDHGVARFWQRGDQEASSQQKRSFTGSTFLAERGGCEVAANVGRGLDLCKPFIWWIVKLSKNRTTDLAKIASIVESENAIKPGEALKRTKFKVL